MKGLHRRSSTDQAKAIAKLDRALSVAIRADATTCATCGTDKGPFDCGHFRWRGAMSTRFDMRNLAPQCLRCNRFQGGRPYEFSLYIDRTHGVGTSKALYKLSQKLKKWDVRDLDALTDAIKRGQNVYKQLYQELT